MKKLYLVLLTAAFSVMPAVTQAATTYLIDRDIGTGNVSGTIVTDSFGILSDTDIIDWNLLLDDGAGGTEVLTPSSSSVVLTPPNLVGTPTELYFDFDFDSDVIQRGVQFSNPGAASFVCWGNIGYCGGPSREFLVVNSVELSTEQTGFQVIGA